MSEPNSPARRTRGRRIMLVLTAVVVVAALAAATWFLLGGNGGADNEELPVAPTPSTSTPATSTPEATSEPDPTSTIDPDFGQPVADEAPRDEPADFGDNVTAELVALNAITAEGTQAGEVTGPAVQVDLELTNGTGEPLFLDAVTVNAYYGADRTPAPPYYEPAGAGFSGTLAAGDTAQARYVFSVPEGEQDSVVVTVSRGAGSPIVVLG